MIPLSAGIFFTSGVAALLYQVIWQRLLALFSGADLYSVTIIVAATGLISYSQNRHQDEEDYLAQRSSLKERLSLSLPHGVWQMDDSYTRLTLDAELGWSSVEAIRITGDAGLNIGRARSDNCSLRDMAVHRKEFEITFPVLKDAGAIVADELKATHCPEVLILDERAEIRYRGRIDDRYARHCDHEQIVP